MHEGHRFFGQQRRGYHHGALKETLVEATRHLVAEKGTAGFTLLDASRAAGVSAGAPYRHFRDREDLLAEVRRRGFEAFGDRIAAAWNEGRPNATDAFMAMGRAYIAFARDEPGYYAAMFDAGARMSGEPDIAVREAGRRAFATLAEAAAALAGAGAAATVDPALVGAHIWALSHGVVTLFGTGDRPSPAPPEILLETAVRTYMRGLRGSPATPPI